MNIVHVSMISFDLATRGGDPFVGYQLSSCNVESSQKPVSLGSPLLCTICIQKLLAYLLTYCFFCRYLLALSFFLPVLLGFSWVFAWAAIKCQLQKLMQ